jgi:Zn-dependent M28 family amino/carboxypeptidase
MSNVRCDVAGASKAVCVLMAHYDTKKIDGIEFVGANDGASGVAVLLEIGRHFSKDAKPPVTLRLLFVDGEETQAPSGERGATTDWNVRDALFGSRHEVERLTKAKGLDAVKAVICLDMVGDKDLTIVEESTSSARMIGWVREAAEETGAKRHFFSQRQQVVDDHVPFIEAGIADCIDLIDFEYGPQNSYWHTRHDSLDKISGESLRIVGDVVIRTLPKIAKQHP